MFGTIHLSFRESQPINGHEFLQMLPSSCGPALFEYLLDSDVLRKIRTTKNGNFAFDYVGLISYQDVTITVHPKIAKNIENYEFSDSQCFEASMSAILAYFRRNADARKILDENFVDAYGDSSIAILALVTEIIEDYIDTGLFLKNRRSIEIDGAGSINWESTIENSLPALTPTGPVYHELFTDTSKVNDLDYLRLLHGKIVNSCLSFLSRLSIPFSYPLFENITDLEYDFKSIEIDAARVVKQISRTYNDLLSNKLNLMLSFITLREISNSSRINFYGCRKFHVVWEAACNYALGSQFSDCTCSGSWSDNIGSHICFGESLSANWCLSGVPIASHSTLKPDIVTFESRADGKYDIHIVDAKYYDLVGCGRMPGVSDIAKQHTYEMGFTYNREELGSLTNSLAFPGAGVEISLLGSVSIPSFLEEGCREIGVIGIPFIRVLRGYSNNQRRFLRDAFHVSMTAGSKKE